MNVRVEGSGAATTRIGPLYRRKKGMATHHRGSKLGDTMSKLLLLTAVDPAQPTQGDQWRALGLLRGLQAAGDVYTVVWGGVSAAGNTAIRRGSSAADMPEPPAGSRPGPALVERHSYPVGAKLLSAARNIVTVPPVSTLPYRRRFPPVPPGPWDLVAAFQLKAARWALSVPAAIHLLDLTDSLGYLAGQYRRAGWIGAWLRMAGIGREETALGRRFAECWVSAEPDRAWLARRGLASHVIPNSAPEVDPLPPADPNRLLFAGNLRYPPNRRGLRYFLREVWPALAAAGFHLSVAGTGSEAIRGYNVQGHGRVADLRSLYETHGTIVCPVRLGSGTPLKILEAFGYGRPVVADSGGVRGLAPEQANALFAVSCPQEWHEALARLRDPDIWATAAEVGPRVVATPGTAEARRITELLSGTGGSYRSVGGEGGTGADGSGGGGGGGGGGHDNCNGPGGGPG